MGTKSTAQYNQVAAALGALKNDCGTCDGLMDYFLDTLADFTDALSSSPQKRNLFLQVESVGYKILPIANNIRALIGQVDQPLTAFENFLNNKYELHKHDWTKLQKTTLNQHTDFAIQARRELEAIRGKFQGDTSMYPKGEMVTYVEQIVEHCRQTWR